MTRLTIPFSADDVTRLRAGDMVLLNGTMYTARDQAHKRIVDSLQRGKRLPFDLKGKVLYYCGPTGTPKGYAIGSCGPTTSSRMDPFTPPLLRLGVRAMIGKGGRSREVVEAMKKYKAVYLLAYAGCGALISGYVKSKRLVAYRDLGPEAVYELNVEDFPCFVGIDSRGRVISPQFNPGG